jgi:hypothetical protein
MDFAKRFLSILSITLLAAAAGCEQRSARPEEGNYGALAPTFDS